MISKSENYCSTCERSKKVSEYWPCQVFKGLRENRTGCEAEAKGERWTYIPREEITSAKEASVKEIEGKKTLTKKAVAEQAKREREIKQAKNDLESACGMFGWDEHDDIDRALHAKNFLGACINLEHLDVYDSQYNFGDAIFLIKENGYLKKAEEKDKISPVKRVRDSIEIYVKCIEKEELSGLSGYNTIDYSKTITARIEKFIL
jgi:hypothetical protein